MNAETQADINAARLAAGRCLDRPGVTTCLRCGGSMKSDDVTKDRLCDACRQQDVVRKRNGQDHLVGQMVTESSSSRTELQRGIWKAGTIVIEGGGMTSTKHGADGLTPSR